MNLKDFESILLFFSEEIEELQAAIDERRRRRLAPDGEDPEVVGQPVYSSNVGEKVLLDVYTPHGLSRPPMSEPDSDRPPSGIIRASP